MAEKHHGGFGVDFNFWHWCYWAYLVSHAEGMALDDDKMQEIERKIVENRPPVDERLRDARLGRLERLGKKDAPPA